MMIQAFITSRIQTWKLCISLAERCTTMEQLKRIHAIFITTGVHHNNYAISKLLAISALSNSGNLPYASLIFTQISSPNSFAYNTLIRAYSLSSQPYLALHYFNLMVKNETVVVDHLTFPFVLAACGNGFWVIQGRQIHDSVVKNGIVCVDGYVQVAVMRMYVKCKVMNDAQKVFDEIPKPDVIQWNVLISGYVRLGLASQGLQVFRNMMVYGTEPDEFCVSTGLSACAKVGALSQGKWIHEYVKKRHCFETNVFVGTALVDMYAKCGCIDMAEKVFDKMPQRNVFSWAAIIGGFGLHGYSRKAIHYMEKMQVDDKLRPDGVVLLSVLMACAHAGLIEEGWLLLDTMKTQYGVMPKHEHYSCIVDLLCRAGKLDKAIELIHKMPMKPLASVWGSLLSGCRIHNNVDIAKVAVKELLLLENGDGSKDDGVYVQLSNIYLSARKIEDASKIRRMIGDQGMKKMPGCSMIEVDGKVHEFVAGDVAHPLQARVHEMVNIVLLDFIYEPSNIA